VAEAAAPKFPRLRLFALAWLLVYVPAYAGAYGFANFLFLCNLAAFLVVAGLWTGSALLLSSQAVAVLLVSVAWIVDLLSRLLLGFHALGGGTAYMWDPRWPLATRLLSLYHVALPGLLLYALGRTGYDRRGLPLQCAIAAVVMLLSRLLGPERNLNGAFLDPVFGRSYGAAPIHLAVVLGALLGLVYPTSHLLLTRLMPGPDRHLAHDRRGTA
jgi:hypothetical protein